MDKIGHHRTSSFRSALSRRGTPLLSLALSAALKTLIAQILPAMLFLLSGIYTSITGVPYFLDSEIPAAVFLGLHLLVTDPSTSPRTPLGKAIFGALYGTGVFVLYWLLTSIGAPTFYDKLLCVPLLNLSVKWIDRLASSLSARAPAMPQRVQKHPAV